MSDYRRVRDLEEGALSPRVAGLRAAAAARARQAGTRLYREAPAAQALLTALRDGYAATVGAPPVARRSRALWAFAETSPLTLDPDELLVGSQAFNPPWGLWPELEQELRDLGYVTSTGHIVHDYGTLLRRGVGGLQTAVRTAAAKAETPEQRDFLTAAAQSLDAFARFIARHADAAAVLAEQLAGARASEWRERAQSLALLTASPPTTFAEALQLVWFMQVFLHAEQPTVAISFGRFDQYLGPFLEDDLAANRTTLDEAFDWVCAFCLKCGEGDESQNLVLGGVDRAGHDAANSLSLLVLQALAATGAHQPSLNVRWHPGTDPDFVATACAVAATGQGQPAFMNDDVVIRSLQAVGVTLADARDYGVVGCYEAVPQGAAYANTVLGGMHLPATLTEFLMTPAGQACPSFEAFRDGWLQHVATTYAAELDRMQGSWDHMATHAPSPFGSVLMRGCLERKQPLEAGGADYNLAGVNLLGLGTAVDSLHALREVVFAQQAASLEEVAAAVAGDFPDEALRQQLRRVPGRYGTDDAATNALAADLSAAIAQLVLDSRLAHGVRPDPGFFRFGADIHDRRVATPDGRRAGDLVSYGCGPSGAFATSPTAVLNSAAQVAHNLCACGNPLMVTLPAPLGEPAQVRETIDQLLTTYFARGGFLVYFHATTPAQLQAAQDQPTEHENLLVRVSGFSARFVTLDQTWQDALISRAAQGL